MYIELMEDEYDKIKEAQKITGTDYELKGNLIHADNLMEVIEDLLCEYHQIEEQMEDLEAEVRENYRKIPVAEQYDVSDRDFI